MIDTIKETSSRVGLDICKTEKKHHCNTNISKQLQMGYGVQRQIQQYFSYIAAVRFIGDNQLVQEKCGIYT